MPPRKTLDRIKLRLGVLYTDPLKDEELEERIAAAEQDLKEAGVSENVLDTPLALDTIERYICGKQNDTTYIANIIKLRQKGTE